MANALIRTLVYTALTVALVVLLKICRDKRQEWQELQEEIAREKREAAHADDRDPEAERLRQEAELHRLIDRHYAGRDNGERSKFDE